MIKEIAVIVIVILFFAVLIMNSQKQEGIKANTETQSVGYGIERYDTKDGYVCFTYLKGIDCLRKEADNGSKN